MATVTPPMQCPKCDETMNHHADKLVAATDATELERMDPDFDGLIQETHSCPGCGNVEFRLAEGAGSSRSV